MSKGLKIIAAILAALLLGLQAQLWVADGGIRDAWRLKRDLAAQRAENERLAERNAALAAEVADLKAGLAAIEERARTELGMIKEDETFFQVVDPPAPNEDDDGD